jgi:hypothetical protein
MTLLGKITVRFVDGAIVDVLPVGSELVPGINVQWGRIVVKCDSPKGARLLLQIGEKTGLVTLADSESSFALEVSSSAAPGVDPETQPGNPVADMYAIEGKILWQDASSGKPLTMNSPVRLSLNEQPGDIVPLQHIPKWSAAGAATNIEQRASLLMEKELAPDRPIGIAMRELAGHRQKEVRWATMRSLALVGDFDPILEVLNDPDQKQVWSEHVDLLQSAVARNPQTAALVRTSMERAYGPQGAKLYAMLWKFTSKGLSGNAAAELLDMLNHEQLAFRVVAAWVLKSVTGTTLSYRPEDSAQRRQAYIAKWRDRLKVPVRRTTASPE